jgi:tetratricopeptide (TPR) repeat protein
VSAAHDDFDDLESERDFLLKSLDDLDDELLAGNIDPGTYRTLHDDYTARASAAIQAIDLGEKRVRRTATRSSTMLKIVTVAGIVVFCVIGAVLLAHAIGPRGQGQTPTGNAQNGPAAQAQSAADAVNANPRDYTARITYARELRGNGDYLNAIKQYSAALQLDPTQAEPFAYRGWLTALVAQQTTDPSQQAPLLHQATVDLNQALRLDPNYPDTYAFKGVMLLDLQKDPAAAIPVLQKFLAITPIDNSMRQQVQTALTEAVAETKKP